MIIMVWDSHNTKTTKNKKCPPTISPHPHNSRVTGLRMPVVLLLPHYIHLFITLHHKATINHRCVANNGLPVAKDKGYKETKKRGGEDALLILRVHLTFTKKRSMITCDRQTIEKMGRRRIWDSVLVALMVCSRKWTMQGMEDS